MLIVRRDNLYLIIHYDITITKLETLISVKR